MTTPEESFRIFDGPTFWKAGGAGFLIGSIGIPVVAWLRQEEIHPTLLGTLVMGLFFALGGGLFGSLFAGRWETHRETTFKVRLFSGIGVGIGFTLAMMGLVAFMGGDYKGNGLNSAIMTFSFGSGYLAGYYVLSITVSTLLHKMHEGSTEDPSRDQ